MAKALHDTRIEIIEQSGWSYFTTTVLGFFGIPSNDFSRCTITLDTVVIAITLTDFLIEMSIDVAFQSNLRVETLITRLDDTAEGLVASVRQDVTLEPGT